MVDFIVQRFKIIDSSLTKKDINYLFKNLYFYLPDRQFLQLLIQSCVDPPLCLLCGCFFLIQKMF